MQKTNRVFSRGLNRIKQYSRNPSNVLLVMFAVILSVTVLLPMLSVVRDTFLVHNRQEAMLLELKNGDMTFKHWINLFTDKEFNWADNTLWNPLINSVYMSVLACVIAVVGGGATAYLITRCDLPCKKFISSVFIFPYIMPSWTIAMFWENFFKNTQCAACQYNMGMLERLTGICVPENMIYGLVPCAVSLGIHYAPFAYILIGAILRNMDANLEEAAVILKTGRARVLWRITLPIVKPALLSTVLLVFASSVSSYTVPMFLGVKGNFYTLSIKMKSLIEGNSAYKGQGYVMAILLILFSIVILSINSHVTGSRKSYTTVTGKSGQVSKVQLGRAKWPIAVALIVIVVFFAILPMVTFALESLTEHSNDLSTFTFKYWISRENTDLVVRPSTGLLVNPDVWKALGGSLLLSALVSLIAGTCGILVGYAVVKRRGSRLANWVSNMAFFPYLIPAMSFGAVYLSVACTKSFNFLYGTFGLLVLVGSVKFLPFASRSGTNAMMQVSGEIEEAAIIVGVPWIKRMTRILFPIQKSSFISGYLLPFISCMRELTLFVLLTGTGTIMTSLLSYYETKGLDQISNGLNLLIVLTVLLINYLVNKLTGASIDKGVGG